jgi:hypothetical protein
MRPSNTMTKEQHDSGKRKPRRHHVAPVAAGRDQAKNQALDFRFIQPQTPVATNKTRPMIANQSRPLMAKPRIERTSQMISSVIISPIHTSYGTKVFVPARAIPASLGLRLSLLVRHAFQSGTTLFKSLS